MIFKCSRDNTLVAISIELAMVVEGSSLLQDVIFFPRFPEFHGFWKNFEHTLNQICNKNAFNIQLLTTLEI